MGPSQEGFDAEWRAIDLLTVGGDLISRGEIFDEADLDAALAKFEQLSRSAPQLENAASQAYNRLQACFAARDWDAMDEVLADNAFHDDRRRMVGAGLREGHDAVEAELSALAEIGVKRITSDPVATRGKRLILGRSRASGRDQRPDAFRTDVVNIVEINADDKIAALITFDSDDFDVAIAELDARYLAGEAAAQSHVWSVIKANYAALNRHEFPLTTVDWALLDHRRGTPFGSGYLTFVSGIWDLTPDLRIHIEVVHRLSSFGAVVTHVAHGTSHEGFDAEWHEIAVLTLQGDMVNRCELFDERDLDAALAKFDELSRSATQLENAASRVSERFMAHLVGRDWDAIEELLADNFSQNDRRRLVGAGVQHGRDAQIADMRAIAELPITDASPTVVAIRGERLALFQIRFSFRDEGPDAYVADLLGISEIDYNERIVAAISFDLDDIDAAFEELDARYLAGEASPHAHTWSVIAAGYAALNRQATTATTTDYANVDHRLQTTIGATDLPEYLRVAWNLTPNLKNYIESVHKLSDFGAVVTHAAYGTSHEGFEADWRMVELLTVEGDLINRSEMFDETDLDAALARFEELHRQAPRLKNGATRVLARYLADFRTRSWAAIAGALADDFYIDDRRRVVNGGIRHGRDAEVQDLQAAADVGLTLMMAGIIATRGDRLALTRIKGSGSDGKPNWIQIDSLLIVEIGTDQLLRAAVAFDVDAMDAAFAELDAHYVAGEAAAHARTWSVITGTYASFNRQESRGGMEHHRPPAGCPVRVRNLTASIRGLWDITPDLIIRIEKVHRLSSVEAVVTHTSYGTSPEGFHAEWRMVQLLTVEGDQINRCEIFDEADLDAALARSRNCRHSRGDWKTRQA